jgi:hypothetical protein
MWADYVRAVTRGARQQVIADRLSESVHQATVSRWLRGDKVPISAAVVAHFARTYERNPLEAFVAAGMLTVEEAGRGLSSVERQFLNQLGTGGVAVVEDVYVTPPGDEPPGPARRTRSPRNADR